MWNFSGVLSACFFWFEMVLYDVKDKQNAHKMGISSHKKSYGTIKGLTHNQGVPGSSPGGTTSIKKPQQLLWLFNFQAPNTKFQR